MRNRRHADKLLRRVHQRLVYLVHTRWGLTGVAAEAHGDRWRSALKRYELLFTKLHKLQRK